MSSDADEEVKDRAILDEAGCLQANIPAAYQPALELLDQSALALASADACLSEVKALIEERERVLERWGIPIHDDQPAEAPLAALPHATTKEEPDDQD